MGMLNRLKFHEKEADTEKKGRCWRHAKKRGCHWCHAPNPLSLKTRGWGGGVGGVAYKDRARPPPRAHPTPCWTFPIVPGHRDFQMVRMLRANLAHTAADRTILGNDYPLIKQRSFQRY